MRRDIKKFLRLFAVAMMLLAGYWLFPVNSPETLGSQLSKTEGIERVKLLEELTRAYRRGNPQKSIMFGKEALELLRTFPDPKLRLTILNTMSNSYRLAGDNRNAEDYAQSSLNIARQIDDKPGIAEAIFSLGRVYYQEGTFDQAMENYSRSLELFAQLNKQTEMAEVLNMIGLLHWEKGESVAAVKYYLQAGKIYEELKYRKGISNITNNIGVIFWELKNYDKSLEYFLKTLKIKEEFQDKLDLALVLNNIGAIYTEKKMYTKALDYFHRSIQHSQGTGNKQLLSMLFIKIGNCHRVLANYPLALDYFNRSLALKEELADKQGITENVISIASVFLKTGKCEEAIRLAGKGLDLALKSGFKREIRDAYQVLSETHEARGDFQQALLFHKRFQEMNDILLNDNITNQIIGLQTAFEIEKEQKRIELLKINQKNQRTIRYYLIFGVLLGLALTAVIFTRYRLKTRLTLDLGKENEEHRQTEARLRENEEKFRVLAEKSVLGIRIIQDHVIAYANPRAAEIFSYLPADMPGRDPVELAIEEDRPLLAQVLAERLTGTGEPLAYEYRGLTREKEIIHLESFGTSILYQGRLALLESILDITNRKIGEAELIKARKMEAVGLLAGGIAHDFNNLLGIIMGNNSMMKLRCGDIDLSLMVFLNNIEKASLQAAELAQKFITFSQGGWVLRKKVILAAILKEMPLFSPAILEVPYNVSIPEGLSPIYGDERQLRQVFINLLFNAWDATAGNNHREITLKAKNITLGKENSFSLAAGKYVQVSVTDNGTGIDADVREKIFDPYFSTKNTADQKGLGLGLAICYSIIKKHEGHITVNSDLDKGTTVDLYIPAYVGQ